MGNCLQRIIVTIFAIVANVTIMVAAPPKNIVITNLEATYIIEADGKGEAIRVRTEEKRTYTATRVDATSIWPTFYDENVTVDRAKAPGASPIYRAWEDDDLFHTGSRVCVLPLKIRAGKKLEAEVKQTYKDPMQFSKIIIAPNVPLQKGCWHIEIPQPLANKMTVIPMRMPATALLDSVITDKGKKIYTLTVSDIQAFEGEKYMPSSLAVAPVLVISGMKGDWHGLYHYLHSMVHADIDMAPEATALARKLTADIPADDVKAKVDVITRWVRNNIRYVAIENGKYALSPDAPDAVLSKRYGDCKGSACLIRAMLRGIGIDGRMVWVGTRDNVLGDWDSMRSLGCGNHMIAAAVLPDTILYLDGTLSHAPAGLIPTTIAGAQALIEDGQDGMLRRIPTDPASSPVMRLTGTAACVENDNTRSLIGKIALKAEGEMILYLSSISDDVQASRRGIYLESILTGGNRSCHLSDLETTATDDGGIMEIGASYTDAGAITTVAAGNKMYVNVSPLRTIDLPTFDINNRRFDAKIPHDYHVYTDISITLPAGYAPDNVGTPIVVSCTWFDARIEYKNIKDGEVSCQASFVWKTPYVSHNDIASWNDAVRRVQRLMSTPLILHRANDDK